MSAASSCIAMKILLRIMGFRSRAGRWSVSGTAGIQQAVFGGPPMRRKFEIGRILHWKLESGILDWTKRQRVVQFRVSTFGFPMQDSSDFKFLGKAAVCIRYTRGTCQIGLFLRTVRGCPTSV